MSTMGEYVFFLIWSSFGIAGAVRIIKDKAKKGLKMSTYEQLLFPFAFITIFPILGAGMAWMSLKSKLSS